VTYLKTSGDIDTVLHIFTTQAINTDDSHLKLKAILAVQNLLVLHPQVFDTPDNRQLQALLKSIILRLNEKQELVPKAAKQVLRQLYQGIPKFIDAIDEAEEETRAIFLRELNIARFSIDKTASLSPVKTAPQTLEKVMPNTPASSDMMPKTPEKSKPTTVTTIESPSGIPILFVPVGISTQTGPGRAVSRTEEESRDTTERKISLLASEDWKVFCTDSAISACSRCEIKHVTI
jgi:hypothetical protein